jgi:hypothetical protein
MSFQNIKGNSTSSSLIAEAEIRKRQSMQSMTVTMSNLNRCQGVKNFFGATGIIECKSVSSNPYLAGEDFDLKLVRANKVDVVFKLYSHGYTAATPHAARYLP